MRDALLLGGRRLHVRHARQHRHARRRRRARARSCPRPRARARATARAHTTEGSISIIMRPVRFQLVYFSNEKTRTDEQALFHEGLSYNWETQRGLVTQNLKPSFHSKRNGPMMNSV